MKNNKKGLAIFGLLALCVILVAGVFLLGQSPKGEDILLNTDAPGKEANPSVIPENPDGTVAPITTPEVKPSVIPPNSGTADGQNGSDIPLTVIDDKPEAPELPDTAHQGPNQDHVHDESCGHEIPKDPALTNPDKKPDTTPAPVEPTKPKDTTPQSGDKDGKGNVYIPGFGWVKDEGGGGEGQQSVGEGSLDKIIGH